MNQQSSVVMEQQPQTKKPAEVITCQFCKYLLEGAILDDCRVIRWIGSGAFGDVYEAEQLPPLNRRVAIKVVAIEHVVDGKSAELFAREVRAIAALDHPDIMPVLRVGTIEDGRSYLVMKYAAHGSLQKFCQPASEGISVLPTATLSEAQESSVPMEEDDAHTVEMPIATLGATVLTPQQLLPYLEDAAAALQYAHNHGIIHLDVKPANLLLDSEDRVLLADFGVATLLEDYTHASLHAYVGTPLYTAPEQWMEQPRAASDQYALAITCFQLLTGRAPFTGNLYSIMHQHIEGTPPSLREFNPLIPAQIEAVILRALAKEPTDRYKDVLTFARAYREALESAANEQTDVNGGNSSVKANEHTVEMLGVPALNSTVLEARNLVGQALPFPAEDMQERSKVPVVAGSAEDVPLMDTRKPGQVSAGQMEPVKSEWERSVTKLSPASKRKWGRIIGLALIVLLLGSSGTLGFVRLFDACLLGICPAMTVSTGEVDFVNSGSQLVKIHNTGTADLQWAVSLRGSASWVSLLPTGGMLQPGKTTSFAITVDANNMPNGTDTVWVQVGGQGVNPQDILVKLSVQTGLSLVGVKLSGKNFSYVQGGTPPTPQTITITNNSGQTFSWSTGYSENTWLVVTPDQGALVNGKSTTLEVAANVQNLPPNTYIATLSLLGKLDSQPQLSVLSTFQLQLDVKKSVQTPTPVAEPSPSPTAPTFNFPTFNAQQPSSTGAPTILRSGYSMVWDDHDDLMFVFGGIDDTGNLLNDLWSYSPASGKWTQLSSSTISNSSVNGNCGSVPAPRMNAAMVWDSLDQQVLLYGGVGAKDHYFGDLWAYTPSTGSWTVLQCSSNGPGPRATNAVWNGSQMLLLGGINKQGLFSDFWSYTPGNNGGWQKLVDPPIGQRAYSTLIWDTNDSRLYVFGGLDANGLQQNDFWMYSASGGWVAITPSSTSNPLGRQQGMGVWDSSDKVLLLMGGWQDGQGVPFFGLWAYDPVQNAWGLVTPLDNNGNHIIPGRTAAAMVWDATDQKAFIYAGAGNNKTGSSLDDLWAVT